MSNGRHEWGDNYFEYIACGRQFRSPLFSITRSVEQMYFYMGDCIPEAEVLEAESIAVYCSKGCLDNDRSDY